MQTLKSNTEKIIEVKKTRSKKWKKIKKIQDFHTYILGEI
jgi:hypothetical protein